MSGGTTASAHTEFQRVLGNTGRGLDLTGNVGFDSLPDQLVNKAVKKGFDFNILCIGETGIGKSTLMESLFKEQFNDQPVTHRLKTVSVNHKTYDFNEGNVRLKLTVVSTEGFGDQIDKEQSINSIVSYIDQQFERYLQEELKIKRDLVTYHDTRLHSCLYFLSPTGHSLKSLDLKCMKELDKKVNIIPIIAKADTIARSDLGDFKARIMEEIHQNGINIYQFPTTDETVADLNRKMNSDIPFAVVGSSDEIEVNGKKIRARKYPWGTVEVENEAHCDFTKLREMLLRINMEDLREATHSKHFEQYRRKRLEEMGFADDHGLSETYEQKRQEHIQEMQIREEKMRQMFVQKVKDKEAELKNAEQKLHDEFERLRRKNTEEKRELEDQKRSLDDDTKIFNQKKAALQAQRAQSEQNQLRSSGKKR